MGEAKAEPSQERDLISFRRYWDDGAFVSEGRRKGLDPARVQMKDLYKMMAEAVHDDGQEIEVVMTVRPVRG